MINLSIPLILLNLTVITFIFIIVYNEKIYYSYFNYSVYELIKLDPFKINKLYKMNKIKFKKMINNFSEEEKNIFIYSNTYNKNLYFDIFKNNNLLPINTKVKLINLNNEIQNNLLGVISSHSNDHKYKPGIVGNVKTDFDNNIIFNVEKKNIKIL